MKRSTFGFQRSTSILHNMRSLASGRRGELIPVARFQGDPACGWIDLAPNAKMYLLKEHGRVTATITATSYPRRGMRWIELDNNFSLQNLLMRPFP